MNKEELIGKLQMVYVGDKNALNEMIDYYDELFDEMESWKEDTQKLKKLLEEKNKPQIFIDTQDMEERYAEGLYQDFLKEENKQIKKQLEELQKENEKLKKQYCERTDCSGRIGNSKKVEELQQENKKQKEVINKVVEYINQHWVIDDPVWFKNDLLQILEEKEVE